MRSTKRLLVAMGLAFAVLISAMPIQNADGKQIVAQAATVKLNTKSSIAKVSKSGVVTAVSSGSATIKAKVGKKVMSCKVTVKEKINRLAYEDSSIRVYFTGLKKGTYPDELIACLTIENITDNNITVNSDASSVNDVMAEGTLYQDLSPHKKAYVTWWTMDDNIVSLPIKNIDNIQLSLVVWNEDSEDSDYYVTDSFGLLK